MRGTFVGLAVAILALVVIGCGSSGEGSATQSPTVASPATESPTTATWTTLTTLRSTDPTNDMGLLVSEEFTVSGDVQLVLDMPEGKETDGVIAAVFPADEPITVEASAKAPSVALPVGVPTQVISGLDGTYVVLLTLGTTKGAWSVEIQTRP